MIYSQQFEVFSPSNSAPISISSKKNAFLNTLVQSYKYSTARNGQTPGKPCNCYKFLYDMCAFYAYFVNICFSKFCRLYYAKIGIGTPEAPARDYYVQVDTGSDIMWVNCIQCNECPKKSSLGMELTLYDIKESLTGKLVSCDQDFCYAINGGPPSYCIANMSCSYTEIYADGSSSFGYFVRDIVQYDQVSGDLETTSANGSVIFGLASKYNSIPHLNNHPLLEVPLRGAIVCKLDIEKAYDHVDWKFLIAVMGKMGFGGLKVNMEKSELIPVGRVENVGELADEFGYKVGNLPSTYLGMPLGAPFKSSGVWDGIEERFKRRLAMWKRQYISKGGRITLIRSTLSNLPIYFMSIFQIPRAVRIRLEKIQRDFLWGGGALEQKPHLVRWSIVCDDKGKGGLGVKSLGLFNKALLGKWAWRFANEKMALWNQVIGRKYGEEKGGWRSCEISPLSEAFPSLFSIATSKEAWVNEVWTAEGDRRGSWAPTFNRPFNDWELEEVGRLLRAMQPVSSAWFPSKIIWMSYAQPKISFFAWEASWGRVLTLDRLQKRGWALANRCSATQSGDLSSEEALDGILGFGKSNTSMISQLASSGKVRKMFAHCLDGLNGGGIFAIGHIVQPKVNTTPLVPNQYVYISL
ncbi:Aspartic proteinase-like protein 2 [Vitis vinifera]|uniref:Aspartic proteinase-like protein 2 n=1 Tax=Vitis vinifera TaxID=29760 RepID=A0A438GBC4_VITVI|nr:Aspartic proteinase-like protein 2 [Vitis vinifera]